MCAFYKLFYYIWKLFWQCGFFFLHFFFSNEEISEFAVQESMQRLSHFPQTFSKTWTIIVYICVIFINFQMQPSYVKTVYIDYHILLSTMTNKLLFYYFTDISPSWIKRVHSTSTSYLFLSACHNGWIFLIIHRFWIVVRYCWLQL